MVEPIETGPVWSVDFYDIGECRQLGETKRGMRVIKFSNPEYFERDEHQFFRGSHAYRVEGFLFPRAVRSEAVYRSGKGWVLDRPYSSLRPDWPVQFRVVDLPTSEVFLGILISRYHIARSSGSGYSMGSQKDLTETMGLVALYPEQSWTGYERLPRIEWGEIAPSPASVTEADTALLFDPISDLPPFPIYRHVDKTH